MSSLGSFLVSKRFWINLLIAIILSVILIWLALWATNLYTHHGEKIIVPNLEGKQLNEVQKIISDNKLRYEVQDSVFNRESEPGSVIDQFPRATEEVKRNRLIKLTIAAIAPQKVKIEQVRDLSLRQAIGELSKKGIFIKNLKYEYSSYTNLVIGIALNGKSLKAGDEIYKGEEVTLHVGMNEGVTFTVPNLIGLSANYAKRKTFEAGLNVGKLTFKTNTVQAKKAAQVQQQSIEAGTAVAPGTSINIILARQERNEE